MTAETLENGAPAPQSTTLGKSVLVTGLVTYAMGQSLLFVIFGPVARDIGLSENQFGLVLSISNLVLVLSSPFWGRRSQTMGRKPVFIIGLIGFALGYFLLALTIQVGLSGWMTPGSLFFLLLVVRLIYGASAAGIQPAATAYIADTTTKATRAQGMALMGVAAGIGTIIGPALGGGLSFISPVFPMYVATGLALASAIAAALYLKEPPRHKDLDTSVKLSFMDKRIFPYLLTWFLVLMVFTSLQVVTAFYIEDKFNIVDQQDVIRTASIAMFCMALVLISVQAVFLQLFKIAPLVLLRVSMPLFAISMLTLAFAPSIIILFIGYAVLGLAFGLANPGLSASASLSVEPEEQGAVAGLMAAAPILGIVVGPIAGAALYGIAPNVPMLLGAAISIGLGLYTLSFKAPGSRQESSS